MAAKVQADDYYDIQLPDTFFISTAVNNVPLYDDNGTQYGSFSVDTSGKVHLVFTDKVAASGGITGSLYFQGGLNKSTVTDPGDHEVTIPGDSHLTATINVKPQPGSNIDKKGTMAPSATNPSDVNWTVQVNKGLETLTGATVSDAMPNGLEYPNGAATDITVYSATADLYGNLTKGSPLAPGSYSIDAAGNVTLPSPTSSAYVIEYKTHIIDDVKPAQGGSLSFTNNANLKASELPATGLPAAATVTGSYSQALTKTNTGTTLTDVGSSGTNLMPTYSWLLRYNYQQSTVAAGTILQDNYDAPGSPLIVFNSDVVIYEVSFVNGVAVRGAPIPSSEYTVTDSPVDGEFIITFNTQQNRAMDIVYSTRAKGDANGVVTNDPNDPANSVTNTALIPGDSSSTVHSTITVGQQLVTKSLINADVTNKTLTWQTIINQNRYTVTGLLFEDILDPDYPSLGGHQFVPAVPPDTPQGNLQIYDISNPSAPKLLTLGSDYTVTFNSPARIFTVAMINSYSPTNAVLRATYQTIYTADPSVAGTNFVNRSDVTGEINGNHFDVHADAHYNPITQDQNNGLKFASYNAVTKKITWSVLVNYANTGLNDASITDPILNGIDANNQSNANLPQVFVPGSVRLYNYTITNPSSGWATRGTQLTAVEYEKFSIQEPSSSNSNTLTVGLPNTPPGSSGAHYWVEYDTTVEDQFVAGKYPNVATLHNAYSVDHQLTAEVSVAHGGKLAEKTGSQGSDGYAHWQVLVNPSQSAMTDITIVDTPSADQTVVMGSLAIYPGMVDEAGKITASTQNPLPINPSPSPTPGTPYATAVYEADALGVMQLKVALFFPDDPNGANGSSAPYVMQYNAAILLGASASQISNMVDITGGNPPGVSTGDSKTVNITITDAGGILKGNPADFSLQKNSEDGSAMAGVRFQLYDSRGNRVGGPRTTGSDGKITYTGLITGTYYLREIDTLDGHVISDDLWLGRYAITVGQSGDVFTVENPLTNVILQKLGDGAPLAGASFRLLKDDGTGNYTAFTPPGDPTLTTGANGTLTIKGLGTGGYRLEETAVPAGSIFILNTDPVDFTIPTGAANEEGVPRPLQPSPDTLTHNNYSGTLQVAKTDNRAGSPIPIAGAVFRLSHNSPPMEEIATATTDVYGIASFTGLAPGVPYIVEEVSAPGFPSTVPVAIAHTFPASGAGSDPTTHTYFGGTVQNELTPATVDLVKLDGDTGTPVSGGKFTLYNAAGEVVYQNLVPNISGIMVITGLSTGDYTLVEAEAPPGYIRTPDVYTFHVTEEETLPDSPPKKLSEPFLNYQGSARLEKQNTSGQPLEGAVFTLTSNATGQVYGTYTSNSAGVVELTGLAPGNYTLRETTAPTGYVIDDLAVPVTIVAEHSGRPETVVLNGGRPFLNYLGGLRLDKTDDGGNPLAGAQFRLDSVAGDVVTQLGTYTTDEHGRIIVEDLVPGQYRFTELAAPDGFQLDTTPRDVTVPASAGNQAVQVRVPVVNHRIPSDSPPDAYGGNVQTGLGGILPYVLLGGAATAGLAAGAVRLVRKRRGSPGKK